MTERHVIVVCWSYHWKWFWEMLDSDSYRQVSWLTWDECDFFDLKWQKWVTPPDNH